jgi:hypothetical protein
VEAGGHRPPGPGVFFPSAGDGGLLLAGMSERRVRPRSEQGQAVDAIIC